MHFSLVVVRSSPDPTVMVVTGGVCYPIDTIAPGLVRNRRRGLLDLLENWAVAEPTLTAAVDGLAGSHTPSLPMPPANDLLAPVLYPPKVICTGTNYWDHL